MNQTLKRTRLTNYLFIHIKFLMKTFKSVADIVYINFERLKVHINYKNLFIPFICSEPRIT
jgi:hypothetical protein